jgi:hypothetical protein
MSNAAASVVRSRPSASLQTVISPATAADSGTVRSDTSATNSSTSAHPKRRARHSNTTMSTSASDQHPAESMTFEARLQQIRMEFRQELQAQESSMANLIGHHMQSAMKDMMQSLSVMVTNAVTAAMAAQIPALLAQHTLPSSQRSNTGRRSTHGSTDLSSASSASVEAPMTEVLPSPTAITTITASSGTRSTKHSRQTQTAGTASSASSVSPQPAAVTVSAPATNHNVTKQRPTTSSAVSTTLLSATAGPAPQGPVVDYV